MAYRSLCGPSVFLDELLGREFKMVSNTQVHFSPALQCGGLVALAGDQAGLVGAAEWGQVGEHRGAAVRAERGLVRRLAVGHELQPLLFRRHAGMAPTPGGASAAATARALIIAACAGAAWIASCRACACARACRLALTSLSSAIQRSGTIWVCAISGVATSKSKRSSRLMSCVTLTSSRMVSTVRTKPATSFARAARASGEVSVTSYSPNASRNRSGIGCSMFICDNR